MLAWFALGHKISSNISDLNLISKKYGDKRNNFKPVRLNSEKNQADARSAGYNPCWGRK
jgi:hypothetical protein